MKVYPQGNNFAKIKPQNKVTHLPMQLRAAAIGISGSLNCTLTLRDMDENTSPQLRISPAAPANSGSLASQALCVRLIQESVLLHWTGGAPSS